MLKKHGNKRNPINHMIRDLGAKIPWKRNWMFYATNINPTLQRKLKILKRCLYFTVSLLAGNVRRDFLSPQNPTVNLLQKVDKNKPKLLIWWFRNNIFQIYKSKIIWPLLSLQHLKGHLCYNSNWMLFIYQMNPLMGAVLGRWFGSESSWLKSLSETLITLLTVITCNVFIRLQSSVLYDAQSGLHPN